MNPEAQRIAIAKECRFRKSYSIPEYPDYTSDLNAMHEAEKVLDCEQFNMYRRTLLQILEGGWWLGPKHLNRFLHATAAQRSEAFLRTLGKWQEEPSEQLA